MLREADTSGFRDVLEGQWDMGKEGEGRDTQEQGRRDAHDCTVGMGWSDA